jgi:hypothetical protein
MERAQRESNTAMLESGFDDAGSVRFHISDGMGDTNLSRLPIFQCYPFS